jgi:hypothetical protein
MDIVLLLMMFPCTRALRVPGLPDIGDLGIVEGGARVEISHFLPRGQRKIAIVHFFCSYKICFAVVPCILQLCFLFSRCAETMDYSYVQFC